MEKMIVVDELHSVAVHLGKSENMIDTAAVLFAKAVKYVKTPGTDGAQQVISAGFDPTNDGVWRMLKADEVFPSALGKSTRTRNRLLTYGRSEDASACREEANAEQRERNSVTKEANVDLLCNSEETEEEALAGTRRELAERAKPPVYSTANACLRSVDQMSFEELKVFDAGYMARRRTLLGATQEEVDLTTKTSVLELSLDTVKKQLKFAEDLAAKMTTAQPKPKLSPASVFAQPGEEDCTCGAFMTAHKPHEACAAWAASHETF